MRITKEQAKEFWKEQGDNEFVLCQFPTFKDYWKECERMNNLSEEEWQKIEKESMEKLDLIRKQ